jgi:hypothetical protein
MKFGEKMKAIRNRFTVAMGLALLLQAFTPLISGAFLFDPLVEENNISKTLLNITQHQFVANLSVFLDIITAMGIIWLGVLFYYLLKRVNQVWAKTGMLFYVLEACMLVISKIAAFALIQISQIYSATMDQSLEVAGQVMLQVKDFSFSMAMLPFGIGAILLYYLLIKSKALPTWLSIYGLVTTIPVMIGSILSAYGIEVPLVVYLPYIPFEFFIGFFILIRGLSEGSLAESQN